MAHVTEGLTYRPEHFELPDLATKTWDYIHEWNLLHIYQCALVTLDKAYWLKNDEDAFMALYNNARGFYEAVLIHMYSNNAIDEWEDLSHNCKRIWTCMAE